VVFLFRFFFVIYDCLIFLISGFRFVLIFDLLLYFYFLIYFLIYDFFCFYFLFIYILLYPFDFFAFIIYNIICNIFLLFFFFGKFWFIFPVFAISIFPVDDHFFRFFLFIKKDDLFMLVEFQ